MSEKLFDKLKKDGVEIKEDRIELIHGDAKIVYARLIENAELHIKKLIMRREALADLTIDSGENVMKAQEFNSSAFVNDDLNITLEIKKVNEDLVEMKKRFSILF